VRNNPERNAKKTPGKSFTRYMNEGSIPWWVKQHLEENMEQIKKYSLPYAVQCLHR